MEKYRSTADPSTGIHPFIPPKPRSSLPLTLLKPFLFLLRLPILLLSLSLYLLLSLPVVFLSPLLPAAALRHALRRLRDVATLPLALLCLGWGARAPQLDRPRVRTAAGAGRAGAMREPARGDLVFVNHASVLDVLYLARHLSPLFVAAPTQSSTAAAAHGTSAAGLAARGFVVPLSPFAALARASCDPPPLPDAAAVSLVALCRRCEAPVVVLAEGCTSNARGVLRFSASLPPASPSSAATAIAGSTATAIAGSTATTTSTADVLPPEACVFALGFTYSADKREVCVLGSPLMHVLRLLATPRVNVRARVVAVPTDSADVQAAVASLAAVPPLTIGREEGAKFRMHWLETGGKMG